MRLSEDKIKQAILHPDPKIRERATRFFSRSFSSDPSLMPLVIKAVETYGRGCLSLDRGVEVFAAERGQHYLGHRRTE